MTVLTEDIHMYVCHVINTVSANTFVCVR